ncbi:MAG: SDR family oxidoreductase [Chloroflexi bacterium]|nr:SDR family oxidoreductase [Chloroflexota bacterium]
MGQRLKDKVAVVTGAGRGIGRAIAILMAEEGAKIVVNDLGGAANGTGASTSPADEVVNEIRTRGGTAIANCDSVALYQGGERIIKTAVDNFGRIDILVNNAGIVRDRMLFNMTEEEWDTVIAVHLKGTFNCTRFASILMRQQRSGRIINMSSTSGLWGNSGQANYGAAKDGIAGFTRVVARDLGKYGITVNAIAPGADTRLTLNPEVIRARELRATKGVDGSLKVTTERPPEDIAPLVVYLATDEAANINGQILFVERGLICLLDHPTPTRTITKNGRWTFEEIKSVFPRTFGMDLINPAPPVPP